MASRLNETALRPARALVRVGMVVRAARDDWSEHAPSADDENAFVEKEGWTEFRHWHLGIDDAENDETKGAYSFPYGDFRKVHRCAVISLESRAGQYDHDDIRDAAKKLLELIGEG